MSILFVYLVLINIIVTGIYTIIGDSSNRYGEDPVLKSLKGLIMFGSIVAYLITIKNTGRLLDKNRIMAPFFIGFLVLAAVAVVEYTQIPNALPQLHIASGNNLYYRPRFLTTESSWTSIQILVYGGLSLYYSIAIRRSLGMSSIALAGLLFMCITTGSKSLLAIIMLAIFTGIAVATKHDFRWLAIGIIALVIVFSDGSIVSKLQASVDSDIAHYTSSSTRISTALASLAHMANHPFGVGNSLYLSTFPSQIEELMPWLKTLLPGFNMSELQGYLISSNDSFVAAKSGIFQYMLYWGLVGSILFYTAFVKLLKSLLLGDNDDVYLAILLALCVVQVTFFSSFEFLYEFFAISGAADLIATANHSKREIRPPAKRRLIRPRLITNPW